MTLHEWETIIQQIVDEAKNQSAKSRKDRFLVTQSAKLEKEPPHLQPHQIDEIVREVRRRLEGADR